MACYIIDKLVYEIYLFPLYYRILLYYSSISRTKSQNLNVSCNLLQLSSLNPLNPGAK